MNVVQLGRRLNAWALARLMAENRVGPFVNAGTPTNGTSGTYAGYAGPGAVLYDITNGAEYLNTGTLVSPVWTKTGGATSLQQTEVALTNAQVLALRATPQTLVAAPGAGKYAEFVSAVLLFDRTAAYTESADNLQVKYVDGSGTAASQTIEMTGFIDAAADAITTAQPKIDVLGVKTLFENQALVLHNTGDGEFGGGNAANVLRVKTNYRIWATGF